MGGQRPRRVNTVCKTGGKAHDKLHVAFCLVLFNPAGGDCRSSLSGLVAVAGRGEVAAAGRRCARAEQTARPRGEHHRLRSALAIPRQGTLPERALQADPRGRILQRADQPPPLPIRQGRRGRQDQSDLVRDARLGGRAGAGQQADGDPRFPRVHGDGPRPGAKPGAVPGHVAADRRALQGRPERSPVRDPQRAERQADPGVVEQAAAARP